MNCPGFSGEQSVKQTNRKLEGGIHVREKAHPIYPAELRLRGIRLFKENRINCSSDSAAYVSITEELECSRFTPREWCIRAKRDADEQPGRNSAITVRIKEVEREVKELRTANEILKKTPAYFAQAELNRWLHG